MAKTTVYLIKFIEDHEYLIESETVNAELSGEKFPDPGQALNALTQLAVTTNRKVNIYVAQQGSDIKVEIGEGYKPSGKYHRLRLDLPYQTFYDLKEMANRLGTSREELVRLAVNLFGVALNAHDAGNRLAILTQTDEIVRDIVVYRKEGDQFLPFMNEAGASS